MKSVDICASLYIFYIICYSYGVVHCHNRRKYTDVYVGLAIGCIMIRRGRCIEMCQTCVHYVPDI